MNLHEGSASIFTVSFTGALCETIYHCFQSSLHTSHSHGQQKEKNVVLLVSAW